jgi:serine/threonine protein kinase
VCSCDVANHILHVLNNISQVGKAADVYSLGIILWEMVTGSQPYKDLDEGE